MILSQGAPEKLGIKDAKPQSSFLFSGAGLALLATVLLRILIAGRLELAPDEAYYWVWSRTLAAGYYDHPPGIAFLIAAGTWLFGDSPLAVRSGAIFLSTATSLLVYSTALMLLRNSQAAFRVLITLLVLPVFVVGGVLVTPDIPLAFGWALAVWGLVRLETGDVSHARGVWAVLGLGVGIACMSKLTGLLLLFLVAAWFLGVRRFDGLTQRWFPGVGRGGGSGPRGERIEAGQSGAANGGKAVECSEASGDPERPVNWRGGGPILAIGIVMAMSIPNLFWNLDHGFIAYSFQLHHGLRTGSSGGIQGLLAFLGGQAGIIGPIVFWFCVMFWLSRRFRIRTGLSFRCSRPQKASTLLWWFSAPVFVLFALASLRTRGEPNWPAPAYLAALLALPWSTWTRRTTIAVQGSAAIITALLLLQATANVLPLPGRTDPTAQFYGWRTLGEAVTNAWLEKPALVVTERYQEAAELTYYLPVQIKVVALPNRGRGDQYDIWGSPLVEEGADVLWINKAGAGSGPPFGGFSEVMPPVLVTVGREGQRRQYHIYRLRHALAAHGIKGDPTDRR